MQEETSRAGSVSGFSTHSSEYVRSRRLAGRAAHARCPPVVCYEESMLALGIDAGGTATRARAVHAGRVVHDGGGGPGNPLMVHADALRKHYEAALAGCPEPAFVTACVAGSAEQHCRRRVEDLLRARFPRAAVQVLPDYAAAWAAAPATAAAVVVAGTGSVVCTRREDGTFRVSGGLGWMVGDHGSAARLGRALLDWYACASPGPVPLSVVEALVDIYGTAEVRALAHEIGAAAAPATELARAAPVLSATAADGHEHARSLIAAEMGQLAATAASHLDDSGGLVALAGGVWRSDICRDAFTRALAALAPGASTAPVERPPVDGAVVLAQEFAA
jgi:N-acetylglucosamine kinase-like BadF-type ATPase